VVFLFYFAGMKSLSFNGKIIPAHEPLLLATNRSYRYGDGLFETMKVVDGNIQLANYHFERLFSGLLLLKFEISKLFTADILQQEIIRLCKRNNCEGLSRVRLSVFRGNGGLYDEDKALQYIIECWPLNESANKLNENGLVTDIYPDASKSCDKFSNLKSANFLPYNMAAQFAKESKLNDCFVLNTFGRIADSTIANVFIIRDGTILTPPLSEGCIAGVMRRYLLQKFAEEKLKHTEIPLTIKDLENADEIFLTNAIKGIQWVRQFREKGYTNFKTVEIYNRFIKTILP
jgi:branched-chain amino acid aminotransferase